MVFSSIIFLFFFFPIVLILYYVSPKKLKNYVLLIFSLMFYCWGEPTYIILLIITSLIDYMNGRLLEKEKSLKRRKLYLFISLLINLGLLGFFKYSDFLINIVNSLFNANVGLLNISLPIGISFYTFQSISYSIDVYRNSIDIEKNYFRYLTYLSLFPQLIAGPIVRYKDVSEELKNNNITKENIIAGLLKFLTGLYKKVLIANNIGYLYKIILDSSIMDLSVFTLWFGILAYSLQIYYDFSGYSDMAIGIGKMLGFNFGENFNFPYIATSIRDFWRRWHISLGTWFKDYVLYPFLKSNGIQKLQLFLSNKVNKKFAKSIVIILGTTLVFFLTGLWHGANYNFILWGLYYAFFLIIEDLFLKNVLKKQRILNHVYVVIVVLVGYVIFSIEDISKLSIYLKGMFGLLNLSLIDKEFIFYLKNYSILMFVGIIFCFPISKLISDKIKNSKIVQCVRYIVYILLFIICVGYIISDSYNPFLYFRF